MVKRNATQIQRYGFRLSIASTTVKMLKEILCQKTGILPPFLDWIFIDKSGLVEVKKIFLFK